MPKTLLAPLRPGVHPDVAMADYLAMDACGASTLKDVIERSPAFANAERLKDESEGEETDESILGTAIHAAILQPELFDSAYGVLPGGDGRTTKVRDAKAAILQTGRIPLKPDAYETCRRLEESAFADPEIEEYLTGPASEATVLWVDPETKVLCKCRPDRMIVEASTIVDLKSTTCAEPRAFGRQAASLGYHFSAPHYLDGCSVATGTTFEHWLILALEKCAPYQVALYVLDPFLVEKAREKMRDARSRWAQALKSQTFESYGRGVQPLPYPAWVFKEAVAWSK